MYLTDRQLRSRLVDFAFEADDPATPFSVEQIGPCSIDLRLSAIFWKPTRGFVRRKTTVDLERSRVMDIRPRRGWERTELRATDKITLEPNQMILARVMERFTMPSDCAGSLQGRSSYARLGLSIHATGSFINPGWTGHMPMTLVNHGPVALRIPVGTPLAQLIVIQLTDAPEADYAARGDRKYMRDTGGPSYWWRDSLMREIRTAIAKVNPDSRIFDELDELVGDATFDDEIYIRLEEFLTTKPGRNYANADELLDAFSEREKKLEFRGKLKNGAARALPLIPTGLFTGSFFFDLPGWVRLVLGLVLLVSLVGPICVMRAERMDFLTPQAFSALKQRRDQGRI